MAELMRLARRPRPVRWPDTITERYSGGVYRGAGSESFYAIGGGNWRNRVSVPFVWCGAGVGADATGTPHGALVRSLAARGHLVIAADLGGLSWGRDDTVAAGGAIDDALAYANTAYGTRTDWAGLILVGEGSADGFGWAWRNPAKVAAMACVAPFVGMAQLRSTVVGDTAYGAGIDAAYGSNAAYLAALPTHDVMSTAPMLAMQTLAYRTRVDYPAADPHRLPEHYAAFFDAFDCERWAHPGTGATAGWWDPEPVADWLVSVAASRAHV